MHEEKEGSDHAVTASCEILNRKDVAAHLASALGVLSLGYTDGATVVAQAWGKIVQELCLSHEALCAELDRAKQARARCSRRTG